MPCSEPELLHSVRHSFLPAGVGMPDPACDVYRGGVAAHESALAPSCMQSDHTETALLRRVLSSGH